MLRLELPAVNVLSKIDLLSQYGNLDLSLEFYTECLDLDRLVQFTDQSNVDTQTLQEEEEADLADDIQYQQARRRRQASKISRKFTRLHAGLADVVSDFGLLHYGVLDIRDAASVGRVLARIDKSNGFVFTEQGTVTSDMFQCAVAQESDTHVLADVQERSLARDAARQTG
jgi:hypothetical protein